MAGRDGEFAAYVRGSQHRLLRSAVLLCGDVHQAQDLLQESLIKLARNWDRVGHEKPDAYVRRILYNSNIDRWRRRRLEVVTDQVPDRGISYGPSWEAGHDVRAALQQLAPRQRAVLVLRYFEDLTEAETARVLGIALGTVKSQSHDGLRRMKELLGPAWAGADERSTTAEGSGS